MSNQQHLPPAGDIWKQRVGRFQRALSWPLRSLWRGLHHPIGMVIAAVIVLFVIADRLVPQRMAYIVDDFGRYAWSAGLVWVGTSPISLPYWARVGLPRPFYAYAANRHSAQAQVDAARHWAAFPPDDDGSTAIIQFWLYGAYAQGYLPAMFELREQHNAPDMKVFRANLFKRDLQQWRRETGGKIDPKEIEARAINASIENRLNHGALAIAAKKIHSPDTFGWDGLNRGNFMTGELAEMSRRARKWFNLEKPVEPAADVECDNYAAVVEDVVAGRLHAIRTCIDRKRAVPLTYDKWRRFLDCAENEFQRVRRSRQVYSGIEMVAVCETVVGR